MQLLEELLAQVSASRATPGPKASHRPAPTSQPFVGEQPSTHLLPSCLGS